ncbi:hypothetical protein SKAU_G00330750 [Synaphobranchus kaupii]|uniref:Uncharacterized protein n=1 Tax=Synaphobranchus kaupii TaxID=118154 RepID=A0A9Q1IIH9_SYNKA|nr:hypothetical protein SKAU_G00330750 [Synaphobranchus kaupii]
MRMSHAHALLPSLESRKSRRRGRAAAKRPRPQVHIIGAEGSSADKLPRAGRGLGSPLLIRVTALRYGNRPRPLTNIQLCIALQPQLRMQSRWQVQVRVKRSPSGQRNSTSAVIVVCGRQHTPQNRGRYARTLLQPDSEKRMGRRNLRVRTHFFPL